MLWPQADIGMDVLLVFIDRDSEASTITQSQVSPSPSEL
jgi:hypothetical protein